MISPTTEEVRDPQRAAVRYARLREREPGVRDGGRWRAIEGVNRDVILALLADMELGVNVSPGTKRGPRGAKHLLSCRQRLCKLALLVEKACRKNLIEVTEFEIAKLFNDMRSGVIRKSNGQPYKSTGDYVKMFKILWRWHMRVQKKIHQREIPDITADLDMRYDRKPPFVYFTIDELRTLANHAIYEYRVLMWFLFDSGIRAPTELLNVKVSDLTPLNGEEVELRIREEAAKTFGRRIKLLLSGRMLMDLVRERRLRPDDFVFSFKPASANRYLQRLARKVFGDAMTRGRESWARLTMYDFRHSSCCTYWMSCPFTFFRSSVSAW